MQAITPALDPQAWTLSGPLIHSAAALQQAFRQGRKKVPAIDDRGLDRVLRTDLRSGCIEVQAQTPWAALAGVLGRAAPALAALTARGALGGTVGMDTSRNAPGPDGRPVVALIESLTLVSPEGELRRASRTVNADLFALAVGGQDLFGALYSVTLRVAALEHAAESAAPVEALAVAPEPTNGARRLTLYLPPERAPGFLAQARAHALEWHLPILRAEVRGTRAETETVLRWAKRDYACLTLAFGFSRQLGGEVLRTQFFRMLIDDAIGAGGSFSIASTLEASRAQVAACYPVLGRVLAEKLRHDPRDRLQTTWYRHHRRLMRGEKVEGTV